MAINTEIYGIPSNRDSDFFIRENIRVYAPRSSKQNILIGNIKSRLGLATGWGDPSTAAPDGAEDLFCLIASLRTPNGVEIMLHNLASNAQIEQVLIFAASKNDDTPDGMAPRNLLRDLWQHGISDQGVVIENGYKLRQELVQDGGIDILKALLTNTLIHDLSHLSKAELLRYASQVPDLSVSRQPYLFPEFVVRAPETLPSEKVGLKEIRATDGFEAWLKLMGDIVRYGPDTKLETDSGTTVRELPFVRVVLQGPTPFANLPEWTRNIQAFDLSQNALDQYADRLMFPESYMEEIFPGVQKFVNSTGKYLYSELIHAFPRRLQDQQSAHYIARKFGLEALIDYLKINSPHPRPDTYDIQNRVLSTNFRAQALQSLNEEDGRDEIKIHHQMNAIKTDILLEIYQPPVNQLAKVIERIKTIPDDADKTIFLWDPEVHGIAESGRPCLTELAFLVRDQKLLTHAVFRSHDIPKGWIRNLYSVWKLVDRIAFETGLEVGEIVSDSESAHAYTADLNWVSELYSTEHVAKSPSTRFDSDRSDPRGNLMVGIVDQEIVVTLAHPETNQPMIELKATTAKEMMSQIRHHDLISQTAHALDIGAQLQAAEIALAIGQPFTQDQPHQLVKSLHRKLLSYYKYGE